MYSKRPEYTGECQSCFFKSPIWTDGVHSAPHERKQNISPFIITTGTVTPYALPQITNFCFVVSLFRFANYHKPRISGKDTPYLRYFSSPQSSTSVTVLQIISKVSDATWINLVKSAGSSVLSDWFNVVDRCSKMRPFSEAGKVKSSTSLSQMQNYSKYLWALWHCSLVRLIVYLK